MRGHGSRRREHSSSIRSRGPRSRLPRECCAAGVSLRRGFKAAHLLHCSAALLCCTSLLRSPAPLLLPLHTIIALTAPHAFLRASPPPGLLGDIEPTGKRTTDAATATAHPASSRGDGAGVVGDGVAGGADQGAGREGSEGAEGPEITGGGCTHHGRTLAAALTGAASDALLATGPSEAPAGAAILDKVILLLSPLAPHLSLTCHFSTSSFSHLSPLSTTGGPRVATWHGHPCAQLAGIRARRRLIRLLRQL